jgi:hypothetical protein
MQRKAAATRAPEKTAHSKKKRSMSLIPKKSTVAFRLGCALPSYTAVDERRKSLQESSQRRRRRGRGEAGRKGEKRASGIETHRSMSSAGWRLSFLPPS